MGQSNGTPSKDPLVNANYGVAYTNRTPRRSSSRFLQAIVTLNHYVAYSYEYNGGDARNQSDAIVSTYNFAGTCLPACEASLMYGNAKGIMLSYQSLDSVPTCANKWLNRLLRDQVGERFIPSHASALKKL